MRLAVLLTVMFCCLAAGLSDARGADGRSPFSWLGFGRGESQPAKTANVSSKSKTPPVFAKMTDDTRRLMSNTKNLFVPKKPKKTPSKKRGVTATHRDVRHEPPKQSFFQRLFNPEPPPPPRTIDEWMSLEQVHP